jgi:hypothetical protein
MDNDSSSSHKIKKYHRRLQTVEQFQNAFLDELRFDPELRMTYTLGRIHASFDEIASELFQANHNFDQLGNDSWTEKN